MLSPGWSGGAAISPGPGEGAGPSVAAGGIDVPGEREGSVVASAVECWSDGPVAASVAAGASVGVSAAAVVGEG